MMIARGLHSTEVYIHRLHNLMTIQYLIKFILQR